MNLYFDTETTGLPPKGANYETDFLHFPHIVQLSWIFNGIEHDHIIKPEGWVIPEEMTAIHGISTEIAIEKGIPFCDAILMFLEDAQNADFICGHNIYFDTSTIKANILRSCHEITAEVVNMALAKEKRSDTMYKSMPIVKSKQKNGSGKFPSLSETYFALFNEIFPAHNAIEDVWAVKRIHEKLIELRIS
jgi:DNA polymerase-3 subunit alpha